MTMVTRVSPAQPTGGTAAVDVPSIDESDCSFDRPRPSAAPEVVIIARPASTEVLRFGPVDRERDPIAASLIPAQDLTMIGTAERWHPSPCGPRVHGR